MILFLLYVMTAAGALILWFEFQNAARIRRELDLELARVENQPALRVQESPVFDGRLRLVSSDSSSH